MAYIKFDKDLPEDPRVVALTKQVLSELMEGQEAYDGERFRELACNAVLGGLIRLWRYADTHLARYDRVTLALHDLAAVTGLSVTTLRHFPPSWLIDRGEEGVELPGYTSKNALIVKDTRREQTRERVKRWRDRHRKPPENPSNADVTLDGVTKSLPPGPGPGPGPGPRPPRPRPGPGPGEAALPAPHAAASAAPETAPDLEPPRQYSQAELTQQVAVLRETLRWPNHRILAKLAPHGLTEALLGTGLPA